MITRKTIRSAALATTVIAGLAGAGVYGYGWWTVGRFQQSTNDAYLRADSTTIAPKVSGYIAEVLINDNQHVTEGQVLARIDPRDLETAVSQTRADVAAARQDIANLDAQIALQHSVIAQSEADMQAAGARLRFAREDFGRYSQLVKTGAGTVQKAQETQAALIEATATVQHTAAADLAAKQKITVLTTARARAEAELQHDEAVAKQAELNLSYATITAPIDGTVGARSLRVGQYVRAGTQLMAVVPLHQVFVVANFKETQLTRVHAGQDVRIAVDTFPGAEISGRVDSLAPASGLEFALLPPDNATGNFTKIVQRIPVKIALDPGTKLLGELRPGMSVEATIDTRTGATTPAQAQRLAAK